MQLESEAIDAVAQEQASERGVHAASMSSLNRASDLHFAWLVIELPICISAGW
jgi:hypothetical protein